ncbi:AMP-binding protein [Granulicella sp. 5B5]|uniref:AMP-binding protein n=1 Tax=Granulicella sp. 5B5 TaxID=1617967 RepID=UPI0015F5877C|nr:AMP-binding protein [Granulicella sp. 5B5]QMV17366.1 AMP-binding protein [Granulicella sp. 5B5]
MRPSVATYLDDMRHHGRDIAIVRHHGNRRTATTYTELAHLAGRFAAYLQHNNIQPGDRILLWAVNSAEWIAAFYGCILRGAIAVPLDAYGTADFATRICADVRPTLLLGDAPLLAQLPADYPRLTFDQLATLPTEEVSAIPGLTHSTPLQILFTSGTTGDPKGIVHTHGNILASVAPIESGAQPYLRYERLIHPLRFLHTLPLSHVFGQMMGLWLPPIFAAEVHFEDRLAAPRLIDTIHHERISVLAAVPRVFASLKTHLELTDPTLSVSIEAAKGLSAWKRWWRFRRIHRAFGLKFWALVSGGGALPAPVEQFFSALGFVVVQGYGMTETTALITLNHPFHVKRGTIGKPLPGRETKITPEGELLVRGPMISTATWANGEFHQRPNAWLPTGDLVTAQPTGELRFLGRASEVIVTASGVNIHPEDLEAAIEQEPTVRACTVVPLQTPNGPEPCAVLAMRGSPDQAPAAIQSANTRLAEPQRLTRWVLWPEPDLPRTSTGKVRRRAVSTWLAQSQTPSTAPTHNTDWLLQLLSHLTGEPISNSTDAFRLTEDLHLDSLARVQLAAALEERTGTPTDTPPSTPSRPSATSATGSPTKPRPRQPNLPPSTSSPSSQQPP